MAVQRFSGRGPVNRVSAAFNRELHLMRRIDEKSRRRFASGIVAALIALDARAAESIRAARSVHLGYPAPDANVFCLDMIIDASVNGSYFMACGWNTGYFGLQQLNRAEDKVVLFSVWDPTRGDDPNAVSKEERVEVLYADPAVRIRRFGGEGTGGQCMAPFAWRIGETNRFVIQADVQDAKTAYTAWILRREKGGWWKLATFRTRTGGAPLRGCYSFVEDFRRDVRSATEVRGARYGNAWVRTPKGDWQWLRRARFTASNAEWEAKDSIDAGVRDGWFYLATGGDTRRSMELRAGVELPAVDAPRPSLPFPGDPK
jgi:hypothetical protein